MVGAFERKVTAAELLQMFGRAGRRGLDETGYALVSQHPPRLCDAQPLPLRRSNQLDWTTLIAVMHHAALRGQPAFESAMRLNTRLFSPVSVPLGCEHSLHSGPAPCGLWVDAERARFLRRGVAQMWGSRCAWEGQSPQEDAPVSECLIFLASGEKLLDADDSHPPQGRWVPAEGVAGFMKKFGQGPLCRLPGALKRYGRELYLGQRHGSGLLLLAPKLRERLFCREVSAEELEVKVLQKLPEITQGGVAVALLPRGEQLFVQLSYGGVSVRVTRDAEGRALVDAPVCRSEPTVCGGCSQREWCANTAITPSAAMAWRDLGLINPDGTPTRRGVLFSFFQHGEGLAVAAALEDPSYRIDDLLFDIADLRGGPRFSDEETRTGARLAVVCQRTYKNADYEGYLSLGAPVECGEGASEAVRGIEQLGVPKQQWLSETLRMGDIERALLEWRSLLRHIANAPEYDWERWTALRNGARALLSTL
ncbi:MAG: hypothetical protein EBS01_03090 [Verrucomicrobia bacterium]|nr:hypothetical protein [Verrucomicrobiota bacterium]